MFVLHRLAGKCTKIYNACRTIIRLIKPLVLRPFSCGCGLCKISAVVVHKKSRCRLWISLFVCFYICDLNLEVIEKFQANRNYRLAHWKKTVPFAHGNFRKFARVSEFLDEWLAPRDSKEHTGKRCFSLDHRTTNWQGNLWSLHQNGILTWRRSRFSICLNAH